MKTDTSLNMEQHAKALWDALTRVPDSTGSKAQSSLIPLPYPYVVPGGRFREIYYWDSYFTMLGLIASGRADLVRSMLDNFAHLVRTVGHIPNGNRTYYLSRSQPPYFGAMVGLYATATDTGQALRYLDALELEHAFWMEGADKLAAGDAHRRVVRLKNGAVLNRYWDDRSDPRPESYKPDYELGSTLPERAARAVLSEHAGRGGERLGLLHALDARPERPALAGNDGARSRRSQQPALSRRAHDRGAARVPRPAGRRGRRTSVQCGGRCASSGAAGGGVRTRQWILLRRSVANRRACARPADARRIIAAVFRARHARAGARRSRAPGARFLQARRLRHHADRVGAAVGRA